MIITPPQNIPADLLAKYQETLQEALADARVKKRYPWHILFNRQGTSIFQNSYYITSAMDFENATLWQGIVRYFFKLATDTFAAQPEGAWQAPPAWGPRTRGWWFTAAIPSGLWYYDYFMRQTLDRFFTSDPPAWATEYGPHDAMVNSLYPNNNYYIGWGIYFGRYPSGQQWYCVYPSVNGYFRLAVYLSSARPVTPFWASCIIDVYEITGAWTYNTITWNNKPAAGKLLCSAQLVRKSGYTWAWVYFHAAPAQHGVYITVREPEGKYFYPHTWWQGHAYLRNHWIV